MIYNQIVTWTAFTILAMFLLRIVIATHTRGGFSSGAGVHERGLLEADHALLQSELPGER